MKTKIKNALIVYRPRKKTAKDKAREVAHWLKEKDIKVYHHPDRPLEKPVKKLSSRSLKTIDLVVVLGGDGTYLEAVRILNGHKAPILGVNMGSLGFLTGIPVDSVFDILQLVLQKKMDIRPRHMLEVCVKRGKKIIYKNTALNDVVVERGDYSHLINLSLYYDGHLVSDMKADGLIFSSPTGSTAYNLAAGGPIIYPYVQAVSVTPVAAHSLTNRPMVFPNDRDLSFELIGEKQKSKLTVDGKTQLTLQTKDKVTIRKSEFVHNILRKPNNNYFDLLREKFRFGERS